MTNGQHITYLWLTCFLLSHCVKLTTQSSINWRLWKFPNSWKPWEYPARTSTRIMAPGCLGSTYPSCLCYICIPPVYTFLASKEVSPCTLNIFGQGFQANFFSNSGAMTSGCPVGLFCTKFGSSFQWLLQEPLYSVLTTPLELHSNLCPLNKVSRAMVRSQSWKNVWLSQNVYLLFTILCVSCSMWVLTALTSSSSGCSCGFLKFVCLFLLMWFASPRNCQHRFFSFVLLCPWVIFFDKYGLDFIQQGTLWEINLKNSTAFGVSNLYGLPSLVCFVLPTAVYPSGTLFSYHFQILGSSHLKGYNRKL